MIQEMVKSHKRWRVVRYPSRQARLAGRPDWVRDGKTGILLPPESVFEGNVLLNEGINNVLWPLVLNTASPSPYDNANARLGIGDGTTAASASQTGLQGISTTFKGMDTGYPTSGSQKATWQATFTGTEGNHGWQEFTVVNATDDAGDNLNRRVSDQGSKASGQEWTLVLEITLS